MSLRRYGVQDKLTIRAAQACSCGSSEVKFVQGVSRCSACNAVKTISQPSPVPQTPAPTSPSAGAPA